MSCNCNSSVTLVLSQKASNIRPQVSSWTGDRAIHRYDVVVYLNQHLTLWITNEDWPTLVRCDLCLILWSAELYLHWCVSVCVCSGNSQEERGLWESEGLVALDTWRHVSPALLPSPHPTLFMSSSFSAPPPSRSRKTESRWSQMNVNALKIHSIFRSCIGRHLDKVYCRAADTMQLSTVHENISDLWALQGDAHWVRHCVDA